ncbi:uncharacterized protein LAESUDRAFT_713667 [Laetiporus sulphureus 93-53]|uniref:Uncharacterized protein n=1 Tax=Laetiporus sulphureus 93-53 TaxID=1314785 RepID=A0A165EJ62_9APHY|nr:uncharacterized protein LAESUDRAFT_713667 [Laetiporus sulphureus 93-53]KZT07159.1 hypothetical protein LAESUDRAFT_713667 [Laetiporus sulphureus 93-53]
MVRPCSLVFGISEALRKLYSDLKFQQQANHLLNELHHGCGGYRESADRGATENIKQFIFQVAADQCDGKLLGSHRHEQLPAFSSGQSTFTCDKVALTEIPVLKKVQDPPAVPCILVPPKLPGHFLGLQIIPLVMYGCTKSWPGLGKSGAVVSIQQEAPNAEGRLDSSRYGQISQPPTNDRATCHRSTPPGFYVSPNMAVQCAAPVPQSLPTSLAMHGDITMASPVLPPASMYSQAAMTAAEGSASAPGGDVGGASEQSLSDKGQPIHESPIAQYWGTGEGHSAQQTDETQVVKADDMQSYQAGEISYPLSNLRQTINSSTVADGRTSAAVHSYELSGETNTAHAFGSNVPMFNSAVMDPVGASNTDLKIEFNPPNLPIKSRRLEHGEQIMLNLTQPNGIDYWVNTF